MLNPRVLRQSRRLIGYDTISARVSIPGYEVVLDPGYEGIRSGVRGYQIWSTRVLDPGYEGIRSGLRGY